MYVVWIIIVSIALLAIFFAVTVAGGKAHDRQNEENARSAARAAEKTSGGQDSAGKG